MKRARPSGFVLCAERGWGVLRQVGIVAAIVGVLSPGLGRALTITGDLSSGLTANDLVAELLGPGVSVSNVTFTGAPGGAGKFIGGTAPVGFEAGIILGSGHATNVLGPNDSDGTTGDFQLAGDTDLDQLIPGYSTLDATVLEFDFVPNGSVLTFRYVFASEEYNEYANTVFNDVFGFFVNGANRALLPDAVTVVSINNVNAGNIGGSGSSVPNNPSFFRNNDCSDLPCPNIDTEADGLTVVLALTADVNAGVVNHMKLAVADAGDHVLDSWVFIQGGSLTVGEICTNLIDDDGDQLVDYDDPDCQVCGNEHLDPNEECDDGNLISCDGCNANCTTPRCGDGVVCAPEPCDPESESATCGPGEICSASCTCSCTQDSDCDDHDVCNGTEFCAGVNGCQRGTPLSCDDGDPCNGVETCNPAPGGGCVPASNPCDDANPCNGSEVCTNNNGSPQCAGGTPPSPLPQECSGCCQAYYPSAPDSTADLQSRLFGPSTAIVGCISPIDQVNCLGQYFPGAACSDGVCQGSTCGNGIVESGEQCDEGQLPPSGCCSPTTCLFEGTGTPCPADEEVCTNDVCNAAGECTHPDNTAACDDGDQCTGPDVCANGACGGPGVLPPGCDDGNSCTDDGCSLNECTHVNNTASCEDGQFCTVNDMCGGGACQPGGARDCSQGSACSIGSCNEDLNQCVTVPDPGQDGNPCDDSDACTNGTTCSGGVCGGGTTLNCDDTDTCTADSCDPVQGCVNTITVESRVCDSCEDGIDNDSLGGTDYEDCSCNLLCESFDYGVIGTRTTSRRTVYMGQDTHVSSVAVPGGAGFTSRASVCAERELALVAAVTIDGAAAARQNSIFGTGTDMHLGFFAAGVPPGVLTTTGIPPIVGPGTLTLTDPANLFPVGSVDLSGTHQEYTDCGLAIQSLQADGDALLALTPTVELGAVTHGIGSPAIVVSGPGPHVLHMSRLRVRGGASLEVDGDADSVVIVQIDRTLSVAQRAGVQVGGGLKPSNLIWVVDRSGRVYIGSDEVQAADDAGAAFAGTVLAPARKIVVGKRSRIAGALLGRKVQLNGYAVVSHHPFTGVGP